MLKEINSCDIVIESGKSEKNYWKDILNFKDLFLTLAWRDINVRYKQTVIGVLWSIIRPVMTMIVFTVVFSKIARLPSEGNAPYAILVYTAMLPWNFFSLALSESSNSLVGNSNLISKIYFPRLIIPVSTIIVTFIDFLISFAILVVLFFWFNFMPSWNIVFLPIFIVITFIAALGPGLLLTSLNVKYRDFRYIVPFIVQFGLYVSPVGFSSSIIPEKYRLIYSLNPIVGVIDGFRWSVLGDSSNIYFPGFILSFIIVLLLLFLGVWYFRKVEKTFADVI